MSARPALAVLLHLCAPDACLEMLSCSKAALRGLRMIAGCLLSARRAAVSALAGLVTTTVTAPVDMVKSQGWLLGRIPLDLLPCHASLPATRLHGSISGGDASHQTASAPARRNPALPASITMYAQHRCVPIPTPLLPQVKTNMFVNPQLYPSPTACVRKIVEQQVGEAKCCCRLVLASYACLGLAQPLGVSAAPAAGQLVSCRRACRFGVMRACVPSAALPPPSRSFLAGRARPLQGLGRAVGAAGPNDYRHFCGERILAE